MVAVVLWCTATTAGCASGDGAASTPRAPGVIAVTMTDNRFEVPTLTVAVGDVLTFRFTNLGAVQHEAVVGDEMFQMGHIDHQHMPGDVMANSIMVQPGGTADLTYRFEQSGVVLIGCHEPGHYEDGMVATIIVTG